MDEEDVFELRTATLWSLISTVRGLMTGIVGGVVAAYAFEAVEPVLLYTVFGVLGGFVLSMELTIRWVTDRNQL